MALKPLPEGYRRLAVVAPGPVFEVTQAAVEGGPEAGLEVAVKRPVSRFSNDPIALAQLATEATLLARLGGVHAPALVASAPGLVVTRWIEAALPRAEAPLVGAAFSALAEVHARGVVHGDLHAANILSEAETGRIVFVDFALGHALEAPEPASEHAARGHYLTMAPEIARGEGASRASDVYALAACLAQLVFGVTIRASEHAAAMIVRIGSEVADLSGLAQGGDAAERAALVASLAFSPESRPRAAEVALGLARGPT